MLRNLCYRIEQESPDLWGQNSRFEWTTFFRVQLDKPRYITERGEIAMSYRERGVTLDLSSSGRGLQQNPVAFGLHVR